MIVFAAPSLMMRARFWTDEEHAAEIVGPLEVPEQLTLGLVPLIVTVAVPLESLVLSLSCHQEAGRRG
jgi:hypothetical protein